MACTILSKHRKAAYQIGTMLVGKLLLQSAQKFTVISFFVTVASVLGTGILGKINSSSHIFRIILAHIIKQDSDS